MLARFNRPLPQAVLTFMPDILLVEDKESLRRVLRMTLENAGYSVTEAADARAAITELGRIPHRVVLTDLRMPHGSGIDVLRASKNADGDVPVIVMTAYGSIDEAVQAMKDGAHDFLQKPVDSNHLLLLVERALEQARHDLNWFRNRFAFQCARKAIAPNSYELTCWIRTHRPVFDGVGRNVLGDDGILAHGKV